MITIQAPMRPFLSSIPCSMISVILRFFSPESHKKQNYYLFGGFFDSMFL